ncbi:MAG: sigma-54-dependent transcriptional regulator [Sandaracinaceae bacterium]
MSDALSGARVAVLDDEPRMVEIVTMLLRRDGYDARGFGDPHELLRAIEADPVDLLLTDLRMPGMDGVDVLTRARSLLPELPVILFTAHATVQTAIEAMRRGAYDYVQKPFDNAELKALVARALDHSRLRRENRVLREAASGGALMIVESPAMKRVMAIARRVAPSKSTVLITGESGTGKEVVARAIHRGSERADRPFVALNVKALSDTLLESELFGHVKGAFTGADKDRAGVFERADGGTLFLDEIGEVGLDVQAKLLRVLQEREVQPVGASAPRRIDVRLLAATNRALGADVAAGRFREDLYFRLAVIPIEVPPLRERPEDIVPLASAFLRRHARERGRTLGFTPEALAWLTSHAWPGNVRELENAIERGAVLAMGDVLELTDLAPDAAEERAPDLEPRANLADFIDRATASHIERVLEETGGKRAEAAKRLGIDRTTLYRLMRKYEIDG